MKKILSIFLSFLTLILSFPVHALDFSAHGYYRLRMEFDYDLDLQGDDDVHQGTQGSNNQGGSFFYGLQRFRLEPALKVSDNISFQAQIDFLDDVTFGTNSTKTLTVFNPLTGTIDLPVTTGAFGVTGGAAGDITQGDQYGGNINVRRIYVDLLTPIGKFRLGRQPSHWGLGIFQNDGNDWDSLFGDTFDRFLYIGKYDLSDGSNFAFATLIDFAYQNNNPPAISGLSAPEISSKHDTWQFTQVLLYQRPHLEVGTYAGFRFRQKTGGTIGTPLNSSGVPVPGAADGNTRAFYTDVYLKWEHDPVTFQMEYVYVGGKLGTGVCINAIQDPTNTLLPDPVCLNGSNDLSVNMGAIEVNGKHNNEEWEFITGFAQGDSHPLSSTITQFGFRPDYHVGLLMFQSPLGTSPAIQINGTTYLGNNPVTPNYVNNAAYVGVTYKHKFDISQIVPQAQWIKLGGHILSAWAPSRVFDVNFAELAGNPALPHVYNDSRWYGLETDLIAEARFLDHVFWNTTAAVLFPGAAFDIKNDDLSNATLDPAVMNPIIFDPAKIAFGIRTTLFFEF